MIAFVCGLLLLVGGYFLYGRLTESAVRPDPNRVTPAIARADGVDYVAMSTWRVYLVQLLNIAGLGPVFGPILGALWGPQVFLWVVFGCILGGAVHDLLVGAMSIRNDGAGLPDLIGHYLGTAARHVSTFFILLLMLLVGTVFVKGPALLLVELLPAETVGSPFGPAAASWLQSSVFGLSVWLWLVMLVIRFDLVWRYFGWANQALAAVALWTGAVFLARRGSRWWLAFVPAVFMTVVTTSYILVEDVGLGLNPRLGTILGLVAGVASAVFFLGMLPKLEPEKDEPAVTGQPTEAERAGDSLAC